MPEGDWFARVVSRVFDVPQRAIADCLRHSPFRRRSPNHYRLWMYIWISGFVAWTLVAGGIGLLTHYIGGQGLILYVALYGPQALLAGLALYSAIRSALEPPFGDGYTH